jgi:hypothetical protein
MGRPSNWYSMSYDDQRAWENNEAKHRRELDDAEYEARRSSEREEQRFRAALRDRDATAQSLSDELSSEREAHEDAVNELNAQIVRLQEVLRAAVLRVELANKEGNAILSAWLPDARALLPAPVQP